MGELFCALLFFSVAGYIVYKEWDKIKAYFDKE